MTGLPPMARDSRATARDDPPRPRDLLAHGLVELTSIVDGKILTSLRMLGPVRKAAATVPVLIGTTSDDLPVLFPPRNNPALVRR